MQGSLKKNMVKTRFAPSPTGIPHLGGIRTALYNYLFAKHNKGEFLLRIEDTDRKRLVEEAEGVILDSLNWLGLNWDGEVIHQSQRLEIYKKHVQILLDKKIAYEKDGAVWVKVPNDKDFSWTDLVGNKKITFSGKDVEDFVVLKSDGFPTYHLANVVDDHLMEITHVIRGEEWISSVPKHIFLYQSFNFEMPKFAHLPVILGPDKGKLSKRHGAKSVLDYKEEGYLKDAILNFIALLGWNAGEEEIISLEDLIKMFKIEDINTANPKFDQVKLEWMNGEYIRKMSIGELSEKIIKFYNDKYDKQIIEKTVPLVRERIKKLSTYYPMCEFFFETHMEYEVDLSVHREILEKIVVALEGIKNWKADLIGETMQELAKKLGIKNSEFFMVLRVSVTGKKVSPPLNESIELLGKDKAIALIKSSIK
jgi:glutamyl-tRNA synthetase